MCWALFRLRASLPKLICLTCFSCLRSLYYCRSSRSARYKHWLWFQTRTCVPCTRSPNTLRLRPRDCRREWLCGPKRRPQDYSTHQCRRPTLRHLTDFTYVLTMDKSFLSWTRDQYSARKYKTKMMATNIRHTILSAMVENRCISSIGFNRSGTTKMELLNSEKWLVKQWTFPPAAALSEPISVPSADHLKPFQLTHCMHNVFMLNFTSSGRRVDEPLLVWEDQNALRAAENLQSYITHTRLHWECKLRTG